MIKQTMKKNGFTLIELLVTITIISILTIIAVSQFNTAKIKARDTQRKADLDSVSKAVNMYYTDYGDFPDQDAFDWGGTFVDVDDYYYMKVVPEENKAGFDQYCYLPNTDLTSYVIFGNMEGVGMTTGDYEIFNNACGLNNDSYNFGLPAPNESITSFCDEYDELCRESD